MNDIRRAEINEFAEKLRTALKIKTPVDVEEVVERLEGSIEYDDYLLKGADARIQKVNDNNFKIILHPNLNKNKKRKRFTIAHEIGHLFLHMGYLIDQEKWKNITEYEEDAYYRFGYSEEEREAHEFAGALLMPKSEFLKMVYNNTTKQVCNIKPIAEYFNVSEDAIKVRGKYIGIFSWD